jgi:hypothetical protein
MHCAHCTIALNAKITSGVDTTRFFELGVPTRALALP